MTSLTSILTVACPRAFVLLSMLFHPLPFALLGGSWVVISGVVNPLIWVITFVTLLKKPTFYYP